MKKLALLLIGISTVFASCNKDEETTPSGTATMKVSITDAPGDYKHVYLYVEEVAVKNNGEFVVISLEQTDTFDILDYTNGNQLLLAEGELNAGATSEIRLKLTETNKLVLEDGSEHDLKVPSGSTSGLKIKLDKTEDLQGGQTYYAVLDFNAAKSIVKKGNGKYSLKPVIRAYWDSGKGAAEGYAISNTYQVSVSALNGSDTLSSSITDTDGYYKLSGLPPATYTLEFESSNGKDKTLTGILVAQDATTKVDSVDLN